MLRYYYRFSMFLFVAKRLLSFGIIKFIDVTSGQTETTFVSTTECQSYQSFEILIGCSQFVNRIHVEERKLFVEFIFAIVALICKTTSGKLR